MALQQVKILGVGAGCSGLLIYWSWQALSGLLIDWAGYSRVTHLEERGEPLSGLTRGLFVARGVRSRTGVLARGVAGLLGVEDSLVLSSSLSL